MFAAATSEPLPTTRVHTHHACDCHAATPGASHGPTSVFALVPRRLLAYGCLAGGTLTGKYAGAAKPDKGRHTLYPGEPGGQLWPLTTQSFDGCVLAFLRYGTFGCIWF